MSVVVGVDGSDLAVAAVDLAAREAALRRRPLEVVYAFDWPLLGTSMRSAPMATARDEAQEVVDTAVRRARDAAAGLTVRGEVRSGLPGAVLAEASRRADLVVVGSHGRGWVGELLLGSTGRYLARYATSPLVVLPPHVPDPAWAAPVLLGADCRPRSEAAVAFAFRAADVRHVPLVALHAWRAPSAGEPGDVLPPAYDVDEVGAVESRLLAESLTGWSAKYPDVVVRQRVVHHSAGRALVDAAHGAALLVVGAGAGSRLGAVAHRVLHEAPTPVAVVREVPPVPTDRGRTA
ncbi:universal stress protein [Actinocatenispora rupis]|uniref:UspA domain-containing protein n=1 Tax=Actinocatenispora rupis TaxID=519421 RepID=A0A8J3J9Y5_9ACTN|nr:universal stress protein [Actinocatenispora rupis]GID14560.1 hypothetical protein Aru02nite_54490 [Actinocatenispora rupis]